MGRQYSTEYFNCNNNNSSSEGGSIGSSSCSDSRRLFLKQVKL